MGQLPTCSGHLVVGAHGCATHTGDGAPGHTAEVSSLHLCAGQDSVADCAPCCLPGVRAAWCAPLGGWVQCMMQIARFRVLCACLSSMLHASQPSRQAGWLTRLSGGPSFAVKPFKNQQQTCSCSWGGERGAGALRAQPAHATGPVGLSWHGKYCSHVCHWLGCAGLASAGPPLLRGVAVGPLLAARRWTPWTAAADSAGLLVCSKA